MTKAEKTVEKEKLIAEKLNGRFAMMGFVALVGAYLTTGQIILVYLNQIISQLINPDCVFNLVFCGKLSKISDFLL